MSVDTILKSVIKEITPTAKERSSEKVLVGEVLSILKTILTAIAPGAEPIVVGSMAKGTDIRGDKDMDIFIQFPKETPREVLESSGLAIGRMFFDLVKSKPELSYAEHPYVKGRFKGFIVEIVPCYRLEHGDSIMSAVDRSPLHTKYVLEHLVKQPKLKGEVMLLKKFMKAQGLYGAHAAVEGFSGYLCELLVIRYGSFMDVIKAAAEWTRNPSLSLTDFPHKEFPDAPMIFIDPVDRNRNVAAAVSTEKLARMIYVSESFMFKPSKSFFTVKGPKAMSRSEFKGRLAKRGTELICVSFSAPELVEDTLVPQIVKSLESLVHACQHAGFRVLKSGHWTDGSKVAMLLEFEVWELPKVMKKSGPFFDSKVADMRSFVEANKGKAISGLYIEGDQWAIDVKREHRRAEDLIRAQLKDPKGFGRNLRDVKRFAVRVKAEILSIKDKGFWEFMNEF